MSGLYPRVATRYLSCLIVCFCMSAHYGVAGDDPFRALTANPLEARVGSMYQFGDERLRLDIGARIDLAELQHDTTLWLHVGTEFTTWTRLRSESNFKFPVETSDYWFGVYGAASLPGTAWSFRVRIAHISSHLVDGLSDTSGMFSVQRPFVYSREFIEGTVAYAVAGIRLYAGVNYLFATQPRSSERVIPTVGMDGEHPLSGPCYIVGGLDFKLVGVEGVWVGQKAAQIGVRYDTGNGKGLLLSLYGFDGRSMHGMMFRQMDRYLALGFQVLL